MMLRRPWITEFIGAALRRELTIDPDWAFDVADELYITMSALRPKLAADSAFDAQHDPADGTSGGLTRAVAGGALERPAAPTRFPSSPPP